MKTLFCAGFAIAALFGFVAGVMAGDFKSATIFPPNALSKHLSDNEVMIIRNFTQEGGSTRGVVTVNIDNQPPVNVLTAAILNAFTGSPEVINNVIIAGPANVTVTCAADATDCFITYKKDGQ
jgi:hypothetical protein